MKSEKIKGKNEKLKKKTHLITFIFSLFSFLLLGCTSLIQKGGEFLEGSAFNEKTSAIYRTDKTSLIEKHSEKIIELREIKSKDGNEYLEITTSEWPALKLIGSLPGTSGSFELTEARIISPHVNGWNSFNLNLIGSGIFQNTSETNAVLRLIGEVERVQISSGKIRLKSNRLTGIAALSPLRNRRERILALIEWMNEWMQNTGGLHGFKDEKEFENYWKPLLFPELVFKNKRPREYLAEHAEWEKADGVKWNKSYTEYLFPNELWELRNSGALLQDWEEALSWIFIEYSWDLILNSFNDTILLKTRR